LHYNTKIDINKFDMVLEVQWFIMWMFVATPFPTTRLMLIATINLSEAWFTWVDAIWNSLAFQVEYGEISR
jgi:hypothetical protein